MAKTENYSTEDVQKMRVQYGQAETDEQRSEAVKNLADELGRSTASIRSKLVNLGIYQKAEKKAKDGSAIEKKDDIVEDIAEMVGVHSETFDSLTKANKTVLKQLREFMADLLETADTAETD